MRQGSADFFMFFKRFCKDMEDNCPKEQKKRAGAGAKPPSKAAPPSFQAELMAKLKKGD